MTGSQSQKRPGRPRKLGTHHDAKEEHRRSQLRRAQNAFRARTQVAQKARDERLINLEATVNQMSTAFLELSDYMIASEVCKHDSGVLQKLASTTSQVLTLARITGEESPPSSKRSNARLNTRNESLQALEKNVIETFGDSSYESKLDEMLTDFGDLSKQQSPIKGQLRNRQGRTHIDASGGQDPVLANVLGNGWLGQPPRFVQANKERPLEIHKFDQHSFVFRLLNNTLQNAYWSLLYATHDYASMSDRIFKFALPYHSKEEILFNLRWCLGPGLAESHILMNREAIEHGAMLHPKVDLDALEDSAFNINHQFGRPVNSFLSVNEIEEYLQERGMRHLDRDTIELSVPIPKGMQELTGVSASKPYYYSEIDRSLSARPGELHYSESASIPDVSAAFDFNALLHNSKSKIPQTQHRPLSPDLLVTEEGLHSIQRRKVKLKALFYYLANISVCLVQGPGFYRRNLDDAILAAAIQS